VEKWRGEEVRMVQVGEEVQDRGSEGRGKEVERQPGVVKGKVWLEEVLL